MENEYDYSDGRRRKGKKRHIKTTGHFSGAEGETGIAPIDTVVKKTIEFEQSYLGNPIVQATLFGFAIFGIYTTVKIVMAKYKK